MLDKPLEKDERTIFIENVSYSYGYKFLAYALLLDIMYRTVRFNEAQWDLFAIIILSGLVMTVYQWQQKILGRSWAKTSAFTFAIAAVAAILLVFVSLIK